MRDFNGLRVWHRARRISRAVNEHFASVPRRGFAHVARQTQRAASSMPTNIVEGCAFDSPREFCRYLRHALGSANELEYHLIEAFDLRLIGRPLFDTLVAEVRIVKRELVRLIERVQRDAL